MTEPDESPPPPPAAKSLLSFNRVGWLTALIYLVTCLFYAGGPEAHARTIREVFTWLTALPLLFLFWKGYQFLDGPDDARAARSVVRFGAVLCLFAFLTVPFHSTDVYGYINRGWQQAHHGLNPYVYTLAETPGWRTDPMMREHWIYNPNPYGFLFSLLARLLCEIGGGHFWLTLALFKGVNVLALGATGWIIWKTTARLGHRGRVRSLYLLLWNPLVLMHHVANGHNDLLIGWLVALTVSLAAAGAFALVVPALVAATLLKYAPALLVPPALLFLLRRRAWRPAVVGCLVGALMVAACSAPYLKDWRLLRLEDIKDNATLIDNSLHSFLYHLYGTIAQFIPALKQFHPAVNTGVKLVLRLGLLAFVVFQWARAPRDFSAEALARKFVLILYALICVASSKFNAWYMAMLLPPALLLREGDWLRRLVVLTAAAELLSLTFLKQAYMINYFLMLLLPALYVFRQTRRGRRLPPPETNAARAPHDAPIS